MGRLRARRFRKRQAVALFSASIFLRASQSAPFQEASGGARRSPERPDQLVSERAVSGSVRRRVRPAVSRANEVSERAVSGSVRRTDCPCAVSTAGGRSQSAPFQEASGGWKMRSPTTSSGVSERAVSGSVRRETTRGQRRRHFRSQSAPFQEASGGCLFRFRETRQAVSERAVSGSVRRNAEGTVAVGADCLRARRFRKRQAVLGRRRGRGRDVRLRARRFRKRQADKKQELSSLWTLSQSAPFQEASGGGATFLTGDGSSVSERAVSGSVRRLTSVSDPTLMRIVSERAVSGSVRRMNRQT